MDIVIGRQLAEKVSKKTKSPILILPDEIAINILSSLPTISAMICRTVCRRWRDLTLTRDFVDLHMQQNSNPMIIVANECESNFTVLDNWWKRAEKVHTYTFDSSTYSLGEYGALFSHAGLIVFKRSSLVGGVQLFIIFNPMDCKIVRINLSGSLWRSEIYGVFLHPLLKEYCSLWKIHTSKDDFQYTILNLGPTDPSFKTISCPFGHRSKRMDTSPLLVGNYLYWLLEPVDNYKNGRNDIMEYDITREEFNVMSCPVPLDTKCRSGQTHLLVIGGNLSFLLILPGESLMRITIWRLENRAEQLWTFAKYKVMTSAKYKVMTKSHVGCRVLAFVDGKLALLSDKRLFVCDLMQGSMRHFRTHGYIARALSHQMSFASLSNCRSTIQINQDGQHIYAA